MNEAATKMNPQDELVEVLLDFIIVSVSLAKKINLAVRQKQIKEGGTIKGQHQRTGHGNQRPSQSCCHY